MTNTETIQAIYAAFDRADVPGILALCAADATFSFAGGSPRVPWHGPWKGHDGIPRFFAALAAEVEFEAFEPLDVTGGGDAVAVRLHLRYKVRRTGAVVDEHQVHWWALRDGKVAWMTHFEDTAQVLSAMG